MQSYDLTEIKCTIENKLKNETAKLKNIKEYIEISKNITKGITGKLSLLEHQLAPLEKIVINFNKMEPLELTHKNIKHTLFKLDNVIGHYRVTKEVEATVCKAGPSVAGLDKFLAAMQRLQTAFLYFKKNKPQSVELENVSSLLNVGCHLLNKELENVLLSHSEPVPVTTLLALVAASEELTGDDTSASLLTQFPEAISSQLTIMIDWQVTQGRDEFIKVYALVRGSMLFKSLNQLKKQQRATSVGVVQGVAASPVNNPNHKGDSCNCSNKIMKQVIERKPNKILLRASQTLEQSRCSTSRRLALQLVETQEDVVYNQEVENYLICVAALQRLMQYERSLMNGIIPSMQQNKVFQIIIQQALDSTGRDGLNIVTHTELCIDNHDFSAVWVVLPTLKHLLKMQPELDRTVEGCDYNVVSQFTNMLNTLHKNVAKALEDFVAVLQSDCNLNVPKDGSVHELTVNVLIFLEQLIEYTDTIVCVLDKCAAYRVSFLHITKNSKFDMNKALMGIYIKQALLQLNFSLAAKSDSYIDPIVKALFLLNNNHYILKVLKRSALLELVKIPNPDFEQSYVNMIESHKKSYKQSWDKVLSVISNNDDILITDGKLQSKERKGIKGKFVGFNQEMEEVSCIQQSYSIPDLELREELKQANKDYLLPKYRAFYYKFSNLKFTKNKEKYVKYTPEQVAAMIDCFFDISA